MQMLQNYSLSGMTVVTPDRPPGRESVKIVRNKIADLGRQAKFDLSCRQPAYCYPGLINVHDHLRGNYLPRIGPPPGKYYLNWSYWEGDLRAAKVIAEERAQIPVENMYRLSAYKNMFSGVTTVNDHFPHEFNEMFIPLLPIRVINAYTLAHECSSFDLGWGDGIEIEHQRAVKRNHPFITHLEEGFDEESQRGIEILEELGCLDDHDLFVHCIGFTDTDIRKCAAAGASVSWCPASNLFMFNLTCKIRKMLEAGVNVCLGTDSTATGSVNLLEEMRFARRTYRRLYGEDLAPERILRMVTVNSARAFRMHEKIGRIGEGMLADLLVIQPSEEDPFEALLAARIDDIELLLLEGTPVFGSPEFEELFSLREVDYTRVSINGRDKLVKGDPAGLLEQVRNAVGLKKILDYIPLGE
jgi:5-methylthioadenosine/S-adenosylhomocysteine deaminase